MEKYKYLRVYITSEFDSDPSEQGKNRNDKDSILKVRTVIMRLKSKYCSEIEKFLLFSLVSTTVGCGNTNVKEQLLKKIEAFHL